MTDNLDTLLQIASAASSGVTQYNVEVNGVLLTKMIEAYRVACEMRKCVYEYRVDRAHIINQFDKAREALDAELSPKESENK